MESRIAAQSLAAGALPRNRAARIALQIAMVVAGSLLLTLSAKARVVLGPVDMSLQTLAVMLIAATFGLRLGLGTILFYLAQGAAGLPVFQATPEKGIGLAYMLGSTGGFLAGFVVMTAIVGWAADKGWGRSVWKMLGAMLAAEIAMMALGFGWLAGLIGPDAAWTYGVQPFVLPDLIKVGIAAILPAACYGVLAGLRR